jgi:hypothetical protein
MQPEAVHVPSEQIWSAAQAWPQRPQFFESEDGSTQVPLQRLPTWHGARQLPSTQSNPAPQAWPAVVPRQSEDAPQYRMLVFGSTQRPSQATRPAWQLNLHSPSEHWYPEAQAVPAFAPRQSPAAPQWRLLLSGSAQASAQSRSPGAQPRRH